MIKPIFEFLLWDNCSNNCIFCHQKYQKDPNRWLTDSQKKDAIDIVKDFLISNKYKKESHVMLVGGELFDVRYSEETYKSLLTLFELIGDMQSKNDIECLYLNTNLIYQDNKYLLGVLNILKKYNVLERCKFTSSYDLHGRFNTNEKRILVENNIDTLHILYPELKIVINTILSKQACEQILNNKWSLKNFQEQFNVKVNLLPYITLTDEMTPTKNQVFKTMIFVDRENPGYLKNYIDTFLITQPRILSRYRTDNEDPLEECTADDNDCGHSINFKMYSVTENSCFVCDMQQLYENIMER